MPKIIKYIGYFFLFVFCFFLFLYWTFPYGQLKERFISSAEASLGPEYDVKIEEFSPSFFTGAVLKQVKVVKHDGNKAVTAWEAAKVKLRASIGTLLFGKRSFKFSVKNQKSYMSGSFKMGDDGYSLNGSLENFNIGDIGAFAGDIKLSSAIDGDIKLNINNKQMLQSLGTIGLSLDDIKIKEGAWMVQGSEAFKWPELIVSKEGGILKMELGRGALKLKELSLKDGDIKLLLSGDIFMSSNVKNYRINLSGNFSVSPKVEQALPILFMVEKYKQADGSYPISITGRIAQPSVKIGDFTLPL